MQQQAVLFDQIRQAKERHAAHKELIEWMRHQRQRHQLALEACEKRIKERKAIECGEGAYVIESRTSAATEIRVNDEQPWALSPFAIRTRDLQSKD